MKNNQQDLEKLLTQDEFNLIHKQYYPNFQPIDALQESYLKTLMCAAIKFDLAKRKPEIKLHIHFNNMPEQTCAIKADLNVGETATVHLHNAPEDCVICPNGHCHAPNVTLSRIDEETLFLAFEETPVFECDIKDLPMHQLPEH